ncbi:hypothetical protein SEA_RIALTO_82 [Mycobacterium phage Rialto]|uniref:DnaC-like helicase loader n=2 Tax=Cheoctovirus TaxID=1623281 RepID=A0A515MLB0_9CAUD|nr:gp68 [Mycobacterium phage Pacc40]YP_009959336.1 hypothetical protein I5H59_gp71 [Mycobacterium phage Mahavrat]QBP31554.1 hypothetical protein SEA_CORNUCOPIA_76 [Mycobacterium phage Cornucopia]WAA20383.1 replisome organizer [Mycobacterium phage VRedHorse]WNM65646.1 hypothetical protein SEA_RIALTO_82 [Mycobacterium phage Rialto]WNM68453.1 hypothetical protein SEA_STARCEVICH_75 [Mycobacterium phage Starcevich]ACI12579.1 hypothetical protein PACC40_68 [Mycobacterium phage Pacc40]
MSDSYQIAANALAKCAAYDPWFPQPNRATVEAWAEQIELWKFNQADVLAGVTKMYSDHGSGFRPLPKDLVDAARAIRRDRCERETSAEREAREDARDAELERRLAAAVGRVAEMKSIDRA